MSGRESIVAVLVVAFGLVAAGCSSADDAADVLETTTLVAETTRRAAPESGCADVIEVAAEVGDDGLYAFAVTVRSSDIGDEKYADAWEVRGPEGAVLGTRVLTHPHVGEQPFTRSLGGVEIAEGIATVEVAARDSVSGFCGAIVSVDLPRG